MLVLATAPPKAGAVSTSATRLPKYAAWAAPFSPAGPPPITIRSCFAAAIIPLTMAHAFMVRAYFIAGQFIAHETPGPVLKPREKTFSCPRGVSARLHLTTQLVCLLVTNTSRYWD